MSGLSAPPTHLPLPMSFWHYRAAARVRQLQSQVTSNVCHDPCHSICLASQYGPVFDAHFENKTSLTQKSINILYVQPFSVMFPAVLTCPITTFHLSNRITPPFKGALLYSSFADRTIDPLALGCDALLYLYILNYCSCVAHFSSSSTNKSILFFLQTRIQQRAVRAASPPLWHRCPPRRQAVRPPAPQAPNAQWAHSRNGSQTQSANSALGPLLKGSTRFANWRESPHLSHHIPARIWEAPHSLMNASPSSPWLTHL